MLVVPLNSVGNDAGYRRQSAMFYWISPEVVISRRWFAHYQHEARALPLMLRICKSAKPG